MSKFQDINNQIVRKYALPPLYYGKYRRKFTYPMLSSCMIFSSNRSFSTKDLFFTRVL